jgi:hypothetical protein
LKFVISLTWFTTPAWISAVNALDGTAAKAMANKMAVRILFILLIL